ncbi:MAG: threonine synthase [Faecalibacterium sp.]|jgi:threonine synthase|nr:threonine synthase [Faecalibacterium sp.]
MQYFSTRNRTQTVSASQAIAQGLAADGGLFVPERFPQVELAELCEKSYPEMAQAILGRYLTEYPAAFLPAVLPAVYGAPFAGKAGCAVPVSEDTWALELWHGPTCAFKDYALQLLPKLLVQAKKNLGRTETTRILVATSGDTGKAALEGFRDVEGTEIAVFYPQDGTSVIQRMQMATQEGKNVAVYAVKGNFDDAQTGVKRVFARASEPDFAAALSAQNVRLSSANSINWGRLVPQIVYYFAAYAQLVRAGTVKLGQPVDFCVPTGNFGDILAGWYAKQMGLPVGMLVCASNRNNVLTDFLSTGTYNARRAFYKTTSPSMDILISSNLERLLYHISGSDTAVAGWMRQLKEAGRYTVDDTTLAALQNSFACGCADDEQVAEEIRMQYQKHHYLCDPHTAVAFRVARLWREKAGRTAPMVVLSTASPFKFPRSVLEALGCAAPANDFDAMHALEAKTGCAAPQSLSVLSDKQERFTERIAPADIRAAALKSCKQ